MLTKHIYIMFMSFFDFDRNRNEHPPTTLTAPCTLQSYFGFVKCKVLPPRQLKHPVLPYRTGDKLVFPLCHKCAVQQNQNTCTHANTERVLTNTWTTAELK